MLIEDQKVYVKYNVKIKNWYQGLGYDFNPGDTIEVPIQHLTKGSHIKVKYICDSCGEINYRTYKSYYLCHDDELGDLCPKCCDKKRKRTWIEKYGVDHPFKDEKIIQAKKKTWIKNYGVDNPSKAKEIKDKKSQTVLKNYGVDNPSKSQDIRKKVAESMYLHGSVPTSSQQYEIYNLFNTSNYLCELNYPCGKYNLDCYLTYKNIDFDIEYDGIYWHKNKRDKDKVRDDFVKSQGYYVIRIKSKKNIPNLNDLLSTMDEMVENKINYKELHI